MQESDALGRRAQLAMCILKWNHKSNSLEVLLDFNETVLSAPNTTANIEHFLQDGRKGERMEQEAVLAYGVPRRGCP